jgi:anti-sigma28 factor (negative regulator of flagellin synthesis)
MRIDPKNKIDGIYEANIKKNSSASDNSVKKDKELNKDRVEISKEASNYDELSNIKSEIVSKGEKGTSADKLRRLKAEIENGTYYVSSQDIADAIINSKNKG